MPVIYLCPSAPHHNCQWEGEAHLILEHFQHSHPNHVHHTSDVTLQLSVANDNHLLCIHDEIYLLQCEADPHSLAVKLRCLGDAQTKHYDVNIALCNVDVVYRPGQSSCLVTRQIDGWSVNLTELKLTHGNIETLKCQLGIHSLVVRQPVRKQSSLRINNEFVETNACDDVEREIIGDLTFTEEKIQKLLQTGSDVKNNQVVRSASDLKTIEQRPEAGLLVKMKDGIIRRLSEAHLSRSHSESEAKSKSLFRRSSEKMLGEASLRSKFLPRNNSASMLGMRNSAEMSEAVSVTSLADNNLLSEADEDDILLHCTTCNFNMLPPIYLCLNGHSVCTTCRKVPCKLCDSAITKYRNTEIENISRTHKHPCRYHKEGCLERLYYNEVRGHEAQCTFCKYRCIDGCLFEAKFNNFYQHLKVMHGSIRIRQSLTNDFPKDSEFFIADRSKGVFHCKSVQNGDAIEWSAMFCGPKERQFFCEITFKGGKAKEAFFLKKHGNVYVLKKTAAELKKIKAKEKHAVLTITSY